MTNVYACLEWKIERQDEDVGPKIRAKVLSTCHTHNKAFNSLAHLAHARCLSPSPPSFTTLAHRAPEIAAVNKKAIANREGTMSAFPVVCCETKHKRHVHPLFFSARRHQCLRCLSRRTHHRAFSATPYRYQSTEMISGCYVNSWW